MELQLIRKSFVEQFDFVAGTSTGGIIATSLAQGHSIDEIRDTYVAMGTSVFASGALSSPLRWMRYARNGNYYDADRLETLFSQNFGNSFLADISKPVFVTSVDASNSEWQPFILRSYDGKGAHLSGTHDARPSSLFSFLIH